MSKEYLPVPYKRSLSPLTRKGILDPRYHVEMAMVFLICCIICKTLILTLPDDFFEDDTAYLLILYVPIVLYTIAFSLGLLFFPKIDYRRVRKTASNINYTLLGILYALVIFFDLSFSLILLSGVELTDVGYVILIYAIVIGVLLIPLPVYRIRRYDKRKKEAKRSLAQLSSKKAPILLLRSFELDKYSDIKGNTFDEYLCRQASNYSAPIISLSDPDEFLPSGGSLKIQAKDDDWKQVIIELFQVCRAVVVFEGKSDGLQWEMSTIRQYVSPDKFFVATPPDRYRKKAWVSSKKETKMVLDFLWNRFVGYLKKEGYGIDANNPGGERLFSFDENWLADGEGRYLPEWTMFDYIQKATEKYDNFGSDYSSLTTKIANFVADKELTRQERRKIRRGIICISILLFIIVMVYFTFMVVIFY